MSKQKDKTGLKHDVILMSVGTILAQSINVLIQPILTRIVPPETLGVYTYIISLATIIIPVASLKLDMLIVTEKDDTEAQYITDVSIAICLGISIVYAFIILLSFLFDSENIFNKYGFVSFFVPLIIITNGVRFLFISYNNRYKQYKTITFLGIARESSRGLIQIISGLFKFDAWGQIIGYALAPLFGLSYQMKEYVSKFKKRPTISLSKAKDIIKKGKGQILYIVPAQFVNSFSGALIIMSISSLYSSRDLGYYSAGVRLLDVPLIFITANVSKVSFKYISERVSNNMPTFSMVIKIAFVLLALSFSFFSVLYAFGPILARWFFGVGYETAGEYIRCLCLMYIIRFTTASFSGVFTIFNKQKIELYMNMIIIAFAFVVLFLSNIYRVNIEGYLWMISSTYTLVYSVMLLIYIRICWLYDKKLKKV